MNRRAFIKSGALFIPSTFGIIRAATTVIGPPFRGATTSDPLLNGLVGWWKMDENTGTSVGDSSGTGNNGSFVGTPSWTTGKLNSCLSSASSSDNVDLGNAVSLRVNSAGTICVWAYRTGGTGYAGMLCSNNFSSDTNGVGTFFHDTSGFADLHVELADGSGYQFFTAGYGNLSNSTWYHFAVSWNGSNVLTYLNGANKTTRAQTRTPAIGTYSWRLFIDGAGTASNAFTGKLDGARIYNRALSDSEVTDIYNLGGS